MAKTKEEVIEEIEQAMRTTDELSDILARLLDYVYSSEDLRAMQLQEIREHEEKEKQNEL